MSISQRSFCFQPLQWPKPSVKKLRQPEVMRETMLCKRRGEEVVELAEQAGGIQC